MPPTHITDYILANLPDMNITTFNVLVQQLPDGEKAKVRDAVEELRKKELYPYDSKWNSVKYDSITYELSREEEFPKNEPIETLLRWFNKPKSKKIQYARFALRKRFLYQNLSVQKKIMDALMQRGSKGDVKWAIKYLHHDIFWKDSYLDAVIAVWEKEKIRSWMLARVVAKRAPKEFVRHVAENFSSINNCVLDPWNRKPTTATYVYDLFATRAASDYKDFVADKKMLTPMQYVFWCAKTNRKFTHDDAISGFYSCMAISFNSVNWEFDDIEYCEQNIKKIKYFFHCLRNREMFQEIMECNDWLMLVSKTIREKMVKKYGEEILTKMHFEYEIEQKKYKVYLHQSVIPQLFPEEHRYFVFEGEKISVCYKDYSDYSYEKWLEETTLIGLDEIRKPIERNLDVETESLDNDKTTVQEFDLDKGIFNGEGEDPFGNSALLTPF